MSQPLPKQLDPKTIEPGLYARWRERRYFEQDAQEVLAGERDPFVIVIPPPNVTAVLHMGHGLNNTVQDVLVRWRRMQGRASLWVPGTDHAGIATQNVVERRLAQQGMTRDDLGREAFVEEVWSFVRDTGGTILEQLQAIGCSCAWDRTRFTLEPALNRAVREVFVRLYEKGLVYRGEYIVNWCPRCHTALSNEEAEARETLGTMVHLRYPVAEAAWGAAQEAAARGAGALGQTEDGGWYLTVSTTRPETMLGDTAVAVHPDDERYRDLVGADAHLPLADRTIPIIADSFVDPEFGTGMVKVTPAHDPNDFDMAQRNGLQFLGILTAEARMNENAPPRFQGMDRFEARRAVVAALQELGLYAGEEPHEHSIPHCYRCDTVVEPRLSEQWFVRMGPLALPALEASRDATVTFAPTRWKKVYEGWLENIRDWCISRQLWWGHRIPVWYCQDCDTMLVSREDPSACTECGSSALLQDPDVLDTWFSSWLWPFSVFGWPEETEDLKTFYPTHVLSTAPEILFFWVARMIMSGFEFMGEEPFTQVYLHGTVRDKQGRKMSKSLGNGIDPLEVVELFGADALRFTLISAAGVGTDIYLDPEDLEASFAPGRNFANKVWNAGRFTLMSLGEDPVRPLEQVGGSLELSDRWILSRLSRTTEQVTRDLERFRLHEAAQHLAYEFFWGELADWYLELVKPRLRGESGEASRQAARSTLVTVLDRALRLLHPLVPFVTTALWDRLTLPEGQARPEDLTVASWPEAIGAWGDEDAETGLKALQELIVQVRSLRKEYGVREGRAVALGLGSIPPWFQGVLEVEMGSLRRLANVSSVEIAGSFQGRIGAHAVLSSGIEVFLPLEGVIDLDRERSRLRDEIGRLEGQLAAAEKKLANDNFVSRAPGEVVEREREKASSFREQLDKFIEKLSDLEGA